MKLDYGTQLSKAPIKLSIGTLRKPILDDIAELGFDKFYYFEYLTTLNPELYYTTIKGKEGKNFWESITDSQKKETHIFDIIKQDDDIKKQYIEVFDFFFLEKVIFYEDFFVLLNTSKSEEKIDLEQIKGVISKDTFIEVLELIQQICCIYDEEKDVKNEKFKNNLAKKLYEKMHKGNSKSSKKKNDINMSIPNIISSISNKHPSLNYGNIWNLTIFQLMDSFNRMQTNTIYEIDSTRVSVWGDEKKTFDFTLWYKNNYDKNTE